MVLTVKHAVSCNHSAGHKDSPVCDSLLIAIRDGEQRRVGLDLWSSQGPRMAGLMGDALIYI